MKRARQSGQSGLEALLGCSILATLAVAVHATALWHDYSLQSLQASMTSGFLHALGERTAGNEIAREPGTQMSATARERQRLLRDLRIGEPDLIAGSWRSDAPVLKGHGPRWIPAPRVERHTFLLGDTGYGASDADVQSRIAASYHVWSAASEPSGALVRRFADSAQRIDAPWRRSRPDDDWLTRWTGFVPTSLLRKAE